MTRLDFSSQEAVFDFLDRYSIERKEEIDRRRLKKDSGFIKSYSLETSAVDHSGTLSQKDLEGLFRHADWRIRPVGENGFYRVDHGKETMGFLEMISARHFALHSINDARFMDRTIANLVRQSARLDFIWLAGNYLNLIWEIFIRETMPQRFVTFKFEHQDKFENTLWGNANEEGIDENTLFTVDDSESETEILEHRASALKVTHRVNRVAEFLPALQRILPDFKAIKMLRIPATSLPGGYDFWDWGKVTYRSPSFRDGRAYLRQITQLYETTTEYIENRAWFQIEPVRVNDISSITLAGTPVTFIFEEPLDLSTFRNFVTATFEKGQGPLRLWGNPIYLSDQKVHIHAVDLHLWKRIYFELTPSRFVVILPQGTCGNTIHRLVSNIQRFISPDVKTFIGEYSYEELVRDALLNRLGARR